MELLLVGGSSLGQRRRCRPGLAFRVAGVRVIVVVMMILLVIVRMLLVTYDHASKEIFERRRWCWRCWRQATRRTGSIHAGPNI